MTVSYMCQISEEGCRDDFRSKSNGDRKQSRYVSQRSEGDSGHISGKTTFIEFDEKILSLVVNSEKTTFRKSLNGNGNLILRLRHTPDAPECTRTGTDEKT